LLQGKWQSIEDPASFLLFENNFRKTCYTTTADFNFDEGETYTLSPGCMMKADSLETKDGKKHKFLSCIKSDMCWHIIQLDTSKLSLSYIGRGNTLNHRRVE